MAMSDRQLRWYREKDLALLRSRVPHEVPLVVSCRQREGGGTIYSVVVLGLLKDGRVEGFEGRFQVVAGWIDGFVVGWSRKC